VTYHEMLREAGFQFEGHAIGQTREDDLRPPNGKARELRVVLWGRDGDSRIVLQFWNEDKVVESWIAYEPIDRETE
jgi:hypothetical protein